MDQFSMPPPVHFFLPRSPSRNRCSASGFSGAAKPDLAIPLYEKFMARCRERGFDVQHGEFGADMQVFSQNDGPVTILFDTER